MKKIKSYLREAKYYETDQMGVIHHSNYIRWFEEARIDYIFQLGINLANLENEGIVIPVISVNAEYKAMTRFKELVEINVKLIYFNGVRLELSYEIKAFDTKEIKAIGTTKHCFVNKEGRVISLKREKPEIYALLLQQVEYK